LSGVLPIKIASQCLEQARQVYDDSVFKAKKKFQMKRGIRAILTSLPSVNLHTVMLAILRPSGLVPYVSGCLRKYGELAGNGLPPALPLTLEVV
jgi:hypothetical protein